MIPQPAYIDPGSGSLIIQAVIAAIIAVPILLRTQISRAFRAIRRSDDPDPTPGDGPAAGP